MIVFRFERKGGEGRHGMRGGNFWHICMHLMWQLLHWELTDKVILLVQSAPILLKVYSVVIIYCAFHCYWLSFWTKFFVIVNMCLCLQLQKLILNDLNEKCFIGIYFHKSKSNNKFSIKIKVKFKGSKF